MIGKLLWVNEAANFPHPTSPGQGSATHVSSFLRRECVTPPPPGEDTLFKEQYEFMQNFVGVQKRGLVCSFIYCRVSIKEQSTQDHYVLENQEQCYRDDQGMKRRHLHQIGKDVAGGKNSPSERFQD